MFVGLRETHFASATPTLPADQPETSENQPFPLAGEPIVGRRGGRFPRKEEACASRPWQCCSGAEFREGGEDEAELVEPGVHGGVKAEVVEQGRCGEEGTEGYGNPQS